MTKNSHRSDSAHLMQLAAAFGARRSPAPSQPAAWLLEAPNATAADGLLSSLELQVAAPVAGGGFRAGLLRPFGGLLELVDQLAHLTYAEEPGLVGRYSLPLVNLMPAWRAEPRLRETRPLRTGMADFVFRGDKAGLKHFYWKRDVGDWMIADLLRFILDAATVLSERLGAPVLLRLENLQLADNRTLGAIGLLGIQAREAPFLLVATATGLSTEQSRQLLGESLASAVWSRLELATDDPSRAPISLQGSADARALLARAALAVLPWTLDDAARWLSNSSSRASEAVRELASGGSLRALGSGRFALASSVLRDAVAHRLKPQVRRQLHAEALLSESLDPFAAAWHAAGADQDDRGPALRALEQAWVVSDFALASALAPRALQGREEHRDFDHDLLLALLASDAGRPSDTEAHLEAALARRMPDHPERSLLIRLLGFNAIFGLGDFDRGRELLGSLVGRYEELGMDDHAGYLRNSMAFALFRQGRAEEAVQMERLALRQLEKAGVSGDFLLSVLQLNLGRLYRQLGMSEDALALFHRARGEEYSPYMLLIVYTTLAQLHTQRGEHFESLQVWFDCLELARDLDLENISYPVMNALSAPLGRGLDGLLTRGDEAFFHLYAQLALASRRAGREDLVQSFRNGLRWCWPFPEAEEFRHLEARLDEAVPNAGPPPAHDPEGEEIARLSSLIHIEAEGRELAEAVTEALVAGRSVALVTPTEVGDGAAVSSRLVLFDPRDSAQAARLNAEIGVSSGFFPPSFGAIPATVRAAIVLPSAAPLFAGRALADLPYVLQELTLSVAQRCELRALGPYRVRVQVRAGAGDGLLEQILRRFAEQSGIPALAVVPFHLRRRMLATTALSALHAFLISSVDRLVLGKYLLTKRHGSIADENLLPCRPRLSQQASVLASRPDDPRRYRILVSTWAYQNLIELRTETRPLVELIDGRRSIAEILEQVPQGEGISSWSSQACAFYRQLWRRGVVSFEPPAAERMEAAHA